MCIKSQQGKYPKNQNNIVLKYLLLQKGIMQQKCNNHSHNLNQKQALSASLQGSNYNELIHQLESINPKTHLILSHLAQAYYSTGNYQQGYRNAKQALRRTRDCQEAVTILTNCLIRLESPSIEVIEESLNLVKGISNNEMAGVLIQKIQKKAPSRKINNFLDFLRSKGGVFPKIDLVEESDNYRKVIAKEKIQKDEVIILIPKDLLITLQTTRTSKLIQKLYDQKVPLRSPKHCLLSIFLLQTKQLGVKSPFYFYIDLLPTNYNTFPLNYTKQQMDELKGSSFKEQVQQKAIEMHKDYQTIVEVDETFKRFSYSEFRWARMTVSSRIFGILVNKVKTDALVPLADMLNHQIPKQTSWYYSDIDGGFVVRNLKQIDALNQIFDSYGHKCNARFLLNYGFTIFQNPSDQVVISVPLKNSQKEELKEIFIRINKHLETKESQDMLGVFRYAVMSSQQMMVIDSSAQQAISTSFQSQQNELNAWTLIEEVMKRHLEQYPTTLKEDKLLLNDKSLGTNRYNCVCLRYGEKEIINFYLAMSKKIQRFLRTRKRTNDLKLYDAYLSTLPLPFATLKSN